MKKQIILFFFLILLIEVELKSNMEYSISQETNSKESSDDVRIAIKRNLYEKKSNYIIILSLKSFCC